MQLPGIEKKGQKHFLEPDGELFLNLSRLRVNIPKKVLADNYNISISEVSRILAPWLGLPCFIQDSFNFLFGLQKWRQGERTRSKLSFKLLLILLKKYDIA